LGYGRLNVLVNNAGVHRGRRIQRLPVEDWDLVLRTHLCKARSTARRPPSRSCGRRAAAASST
jgi:NAD(P)-dependent dehydrogenase (short-subunit alcohol dehydrogenase family)